MLNAELQLVCKMGLLQAKHFGLHEIGSRWPDLKHLGLFVLHQAYATCRYTQIMYAVGPSLTAGFDTACTVRHSNLGQLCTI